MGTRFFCTVHHVGGSTFYPVHSHNIDQYTSLYYMDFHLLGDLYLTLYQRVYI